MVSLARATLVYEWRRFLAAVLAVAFSGLLVLVQLGLLVGMFGTVAVYIDESAADLWVGFAGTQSVDLGKPFNAQIETRLHIHPAVADVEPFIFGQSDWRTPAGANLYAYLLGIDPAQDAMAFAKVLPAATRALLLEPMTVIIDEADREKLGVPQVPTAAPSTEPAAAVYAEIGGRRVKVLAAIKGLRAIGGVNIVTSLSSARAIDGSAAKERQEVSYFLLRLKPGSHPETVRAELAPKGGVKSFQVWTAAEFSRHSQLYWLTESGAGAGFAFSTLLGLLVGIIVTSQTLMAAITASIREYATLRALGVARGSLRAVVLEQSFWIGIAGLALTGGLSAAIAAIAHAAYVAIVFPGWAIGLTAALILIIAIGSGLLALRALGRADPAALLR
jgi:putative ABC transport system permease protein